MKFDAVIIGAGAAGSVLAAQLSSLKILVVEKKPKERWSPQIIALSHSSMLLLQQFGLYPEGTPIHTVHVSVKGGSGAHIITHTSQQIPNLGHVLPMAHLEQTAYRLATQSPTVTWWQPDECLNYSLITTGWQLAFSHTTVETPLLIVADGAHSKIAQTLGISYQSYPYTHVGLIARVTWQMPLNGIAYERFLPKSTLAVLPMGDNTSVCVWTLPPDIAKNFKTDEMTLKEALAEAMGYRLGRIKTVENIIIRPFEQTVAEQTVGARWVLLGNAAHTLHPIAAQGFNLTLRDSAVLANKLLTNRSLQQYDSQRQKDRQRITDITHFLAHQVTEKAWPSVCLTLGLQLSQLPWIRSHIAHLGLGTA